MISTCLLFLYFPLDSIFVLSSESPLHWVNSFPSTTVDKNTVQRWELRYAANLLLGTL